MKVELIEAVRNRHARKVHRYYRPSGVLIAPGGYIYLVQIEGTEWYKIGKSVQPEYRLNNLSVIMPFDFLPIHTIETDNMLILEKALHDYFKDKLVRGEWYKLSPDEVKEITEIRKIVCHGQGVITFYLDDDAVIPSGIATVADENLPSPIEDDTLSA